MQVIKPAKIDNTALVSSNVAENDQPEWNVSTSYVTGDKVMVTGTTHKVYEALQASTGQDPVADTTFAYWNPAGATNRWKAFDNKIGDVVSNAQSITYEILSNSRVTGIAFFGISGQSVRVTVTDTSSTVVYDVTKQLVDTSDVTDWFQFYTWEPTFSAEIIFRGVPGYAGSIIDIIVDAGVDTAEIGQIVMGDDVNLGTTLVDTAVGMVDFSRTDRDEFGVVTIIRRDFASTVDFRFSVNTVEVGRVSRVLKNLRAIPSAYYAGDDTDHFGTTVFGFFSGFEIPLSAGTKSFIELNIESLT